MEFKASLNNIRVSPRKARLIANLIKGMNAAQAQAQLASFSKKNAGLILKLLNSALANVKHNFSDEIKPENLIVAKIVVEGGPTLKRWLPRAMGRATPLMKRTCSVKLILAEQQPGAHKIKAKKSRPEVLKADQVVPETEASMSEPVNEEKEIERKVIPPEKPYGASGAAKKRSFSRQTFGNIKKVFRRKSI